MPPSKPKQLPESQSYSLSVCSRSRSIRSTVRVSSSAGRPSSSKSHTFSPSAVTLICHSALNHRPFFPTIENLSLAKFPTITALYIVRASVKPRQYEERENLRLTSHSALISSTLLPSSRITSEQSNGVFRSNVCRSNRAFAVRSLFASSRSLGVCRG